VGFIVLGFPSMVDEVGATTTQELQSDLGALSVQLDAEIVERLDQIWPGPGEAPQAYAW
jgi:aryl-alcohol dehydrogenase-like predicted oxidoreductase